MRRNMRLVREILSEMENTDPFAKEETESFNIGKLDGHWDVKKVSYHLVLLIEGGFLARDTLHEGRWSEGSSREKDASLRLTWRGHDLLEELKDEASRF